MKLASITKRISAQWLALLTIFGMAVCFVPGFAQGQTIAVDDSAITPPDSTVIINVVDNDIAGTLPLQLQSLVLPQVLSNGTLVGQDLVNGTFTYTANEGLGSIEPDSFDYEVCDSATPTRSCATATVYVYVAIPITTFDIIPKKLNVKKMGVIPVVIRSTETFDVATIDDPGSLELAGVTPHRWHMGKKKLTLKFKAQDIVGPIRNDVSHGDEIVLHLTGRLINELDPEAEGPVIVGEDTVIIIKKGKQN
jgi:hypothetical protein